MRIDQEPWTDEGPTLIWNVGPVSDSLPVWARSVLALREGEPLGAA